MTAAVLRRHAEEAAVLAWPAAETRLLDGWLWRASGGGSQRANSVSTLCYRGPDVERSIDEVEALYRSRGAPVRIQVAIGVCAPADLDERLARRGYAIVDPVTALVKDPLAPTLLHEVECADTPGADWLGVYLENITPDRRGSAAEILDRVPGPRAFLLAREGSAAVATALAVVHGPVVIAECVGTLASARRKGAAARVMAGVEAFGARHGAAVVALQAVAANGPAQGLYARLGYREIGRSHYRVRD